MSQRPSNKIYKIIRKNSKGFMAGLFAGLLIVSLAANTSSFSGSLMHGAAGMLSNTSPTLNKTMAEPEDDTRSTDSEPDSEPERMAITPSVTEAPHLSRPSENSTLNSGDTFLKAYFGSRFDPAPSRTETEGDAHYRTVSDASESDTTLSDVAIEDNSYTFGITDTWDPGDNSPQGATVLEVPTFAFQSQSGHSVSSTDFEDWYQVDLDYGDTYKFWTFNEATEMKLDLFREFYFNAPLVEDQETFGVKRGFVLYTAEKAGTYFIRVMADNPGAEGNYSFFWQKTTEGSEDEWDPQDDIAAGATLIDTPTALKDLVFHKPHTVSAVDQADWFKVALEYGNTYRLNTFSETVNMYMELYSSEDLNEPVATDQEQFGVTRAVIDFAVPSEGIYYVKVMADEKSAEGSYTLHLQKTAESIADPWDPQDDTLTGAQNMGPIDAEGVFQPDHTLSNIDLVDWYGIYLQTGKTYRVYTSHETTGFRLDLYHGGIAEDDLVSADQETFGKNRGYVEFTPTKTGFYLAKVSTDIPEDAGSYAFNAELREPLLHNLESGK
jgi:hypothetical protein